MEQHHASPSHLPTLDPQSSTHISGTPEVLVIKPDHDTMAHQPCKPTAQSESALQESNSESELFWCPWLYSVLTIPDHPSQAPADTCALPPYPLCPGPLLDANTPPVTRRALSQDFAHAYPSLALIYSAVKSVGAPNYRGARQPVPHNINVPAWRKRSHLFNDPSLIEMYRVHSLTFTGLIFRQPSFCHPAPVRCHSLHQQGARACSHHWPSPVSPIPVAPVQSYDDQAQEGFLRASCHRGSLHAPGHQCQLQHSQELPLFWPAVLQGALPRFIQE